LILAFLDAVGNDSWKVAWYGLAMGLAVGGIFMLCLQFQHLRRGLGRWNERCRNATDADRGDEEPTSGDRGDLEAE
jgi:hypothetical protein